VGSVCLDLVRPMIESESLVRSPGRAHGKKQIPRNSDDRRRRPCLDVEEQSTTAHNADDNFFTAIGGVDRKDVVIAKRKFMKRRGGSRFEDMESPITPPSRYSLAVLHNQCVRTVLDVESARPYGIRVTRCARRPYPTGPMFGERHRDVALRIVSE